MCSFAHRARSPLLQCFLHEEEQCNVALTCDVISVRIERLSVSRVTLLAEFDCTF